MNNWDQLELTLDSIFSDQDKLNSYIASHSHTFDAETNEHVILIEYRFSTESPSDFASGFPTVSKYVLYLNELSK